MSVKKLTKHELTQTQSYIAGFAFSLILTAIPYYIVVNETMSDNALLFSLMGYAVLQFCVQIYFFLHLGSESKPRWKLANLVFMLSVILFIVIGTLWIMNNLNYNMMHMDPKATEQKLLEDQNYQNRMDDNIDHSNM